MKKLFILLSLVSIVFFATTGAWAYTISPISLANFTSMAGTELSSLPMSSPTTIIGPTFSTTLNFKVYYNSTTGVYTYAYQLKNDASSQTNLARLTIDSANTLTIYNMPGGSPTTDSYGYVVPPNVLYQLPTGFVSANAGFNGYFGFQFVDANSTALLNPGETTAWMYARYLEPPTIVSSSVQDGSSGNGSVVGPGGPVPEPATMSLLGMGILGLLGLRKKKIA